MGEKYVALADTNNLLQKIVEMKCICLIPLSDPFIFVKK